MVTQIFSLKFCVAEEFTTARDFFFQIEMQVFNQIIKKKVHYSKLQIAYRIHGDSDLFIIFIVIIVVIVVV